MELSQNTENDQCSDFSADPKVSPDSPKVFSTASTDNSTSATCEIKTCHDNTKNTSVEPTGESEKKQSPRRTADISDNVSQFRTGCGLRDLYRKHLRPIEDQCLYSHFSCGTEAGAIADNEWTAPPQVLLVGQYSTGKTSFINYLTGGKGYPGMHIGSEPTTDKFVAVMGEREEEDKCEEMMNGKRKRREGDCNETDTHRRGRVIKGNSLTVMPGLPYSGLGSFGAAFLDRFEAAICPPTSHPLLSAVTFIDTPGILSGEKQRIARSYDFAEVCRWFANRADLVLLLFDAHKLDISDEFREVLDALRPHTDKVRCVLNKADQVSAEELVRVYGSLMWSMGKILGSPEVVRVYTGSYWGGACGHKQFLKMFEADEQLLVGELKDLPNTASSRRVNELVRRVRKVKVHVALLTYLRAQMPRFIGKQSAQDNLIDNIGEVFEKVRIMYNLSEGDFPEEILFASKLRQHDFRTFPALDRQIFQNLDDLIQIHIPNLLTSIDNTIENQPIACPEKNEPRRFKFLRPF
eukprot:CAMPEP_0194309236 /NCGR_PEP_ID=MMETSP0171-20130528/6210_1 /TAXON_ID=218684 /ORGANISM="Corethron pennatum, Strain L29A3" /LENGTH=521 /DNA_ID=CAMNT_0039062305 /DNA_START=277 /DNA_END=1845 /DNA_ORIENTATION=-